VEHQFAEYIQTLSAADATRLTTFLIGAEGQTDQLRRSETLLRDHPECAEGLANCCFFVARNYWATLHFLARLLERCALNASCVRLEQEARAALGEYAERQSWVFDHDLTQAEAIMTEANARARKAFAEGRLVEADDALQIFHSFANPFFRALTPLADLLRNVAAYRTSMRSPVACDGDYNPFFSDVTTPRRVEFARLIADEMPPDGICLEIGCYDGSTLAAVGQEVERRGEGCALFGVEPSRAALLYARRARPHLRLIEGDVGDLVEGRLEAQLPRIVDVVCISGVCEQLSDSEFRAVIDWCARTCQVLAISDDVVNLDGPEAVNRGCYTLHPFRSILNRAGFRITHFSMVPETSRAYSGYIIARRDVHLNKNRESHAGPGQHVNHFPTT
jgi:hypothetical protein